MMKVLCLITFGLIATSLAGEQFLIGQVRDFKAAFPVFEAAAGDDKNIPNVNLDVDGKPSLNGAHPSISSSTAFAKLFRDVSGENYGFAYVLHLDALNQGGEFFFDSSSWFPADDYGFGNEGNNHNYHFTAEFNGKFTYLGSGYLTIKSTDDCWVFINGKLAMDFGGVHSVETQTLQVSTLGLTNGVEYDIAIYKVQRNKASGSTFFVQTNILFSLATIPGPAQTNPGKPAYICEVYYPNFCADGECPEDPSLTLNNIKYPMTENFNVISFDSFYAASGDVEGRAAVRNGFNVPNGGFSVGYELRTGGSSATDNSLPYSLVVGGDATFPSGDVYPSGNNLPYVGAKEGIFVGGLFTAPNYLQARRTGGPCGTAGCLNDDFDNAKDYYTMLSAAFDNVADYGSATIQWTTFKLNCPSNLADSYSVHVTAADFNTVRAYDLTGCNENAQIVINIGGTGNVNFEGNNIYHRPAKVLYNILGTRTVNVLTEVRGSILAPNSQYKQVGGVVKGNVIVDNVVQAHQINKLTCVRIGLPPTPPSTSHICPYYEEQCAGLDFPLANGVYSFRDFNVISFQDFTADTGDVEGRLAAQNDVKLGFGYSIGAELKTKGNKPDNSLPYSLVVGRDLAWGSGSLHPDGTFGYPGNREDMFVGGNFQTAADYLTTRRTGGPCAYSGCLDGYFNAAKQCYNTFSANLAAVPDNVAKRIEWSALIITCSDNAAPRYTVSITPTEMSQFTYVMLDNCNFQAEWAINVRGTENVNFRGDTFPAPAGGVVYNVIGSGRTISVTETALGGHLLAPGNTLDQTGGVVIGKVVAGNVKFSLQINKPNCPEPGTVTVPVVVVEPPSLSSPSNSLYLGGLSAPNFIAGSTVSISGLTYEVTAVVNEVSADGSIQHTRLDLDRAIIAYPPAGAQVVGQVDGTKSTPPANTESSAAASLTVALTFVFALVVLLF